MNDGKKKKKRLDTSLMPFFIPGAVDTIPMPPPIQFVESPHIEITKAEKMSLFRAYLIYTGITTALPMGHETMGAMLGSRAGVQLAGRWGAFGGGVIGYTLAVGIVGGIATAIDPADLYEGGLAEYIPPGISEPAIWGLKEGYNRGPLTQSPHIQYMKKELGAAKKDLWDEPKEWLTANW